jgi:hypothetical protein
MAGRIALIAAALMIVALRASAQQSVSVYGGVQMALQDGYGITGRGIFASYYQPISPSVEVGGSIGYSQLQDSWYAPVATGIRYRPFPFRTSPILGFEIGTSFLSTDLNSSDNPTLFSPQLGVVVPLGGALDLKLMARADVMKQNSDWWGYVWYSAGVGYTW